MNITDDSWRITSTSNFRLAVQESLEPGATMSFTGTSAPEPLWTPGSVKVWAGTHGTWERRITIGDADMLQACKNDVNNLFPPEAFSSVDPLFNDLDSVVYEEDEAVWRWSPAAQIYPEQERVLNDHVSKYPFSQTVVETANLACLIAHPDYTWGSSLTSTEIENFIITKRTDNCWVVSLFDNMETTDGRILDKGIFFKLTQDVSLKKTASPNRLVCLWRS